MAAAPATKAKTPAKKAPASKKPATPKATKAKTATGRIARVTGPVVDIEFPHDAIPGIYNALETTVSLGGETTKLVLEVAQHLGDDVVRAIALMPTDGLVRGLEVVDTGAPISVPVGDVTTGKVFNVNSNVVVRQPIVNHYFTISINTSSREGTTTL